MTALRPLFAWTLLALVAAGGVVGPGAHETAHALEALEARAAHGADGHHHTGDGASEECPEGEHADDCLACHVVPAAPTVGGVASTAVQAVEADFARPAVEAVAALPRGPTPVRGPPTA